MTQLVINIEDASVKATLKQALLKVMSNFKGVSFEEEDSYTLDDALEEVRRGDVIIYESAEDFLNHLRREIQD
jgi:hypothetical protein